MKTLQSTQSLHSRAASYGLPPMEAVTRIFSGNCKWDLVISGAYVRSHQDRRGLSVHTNHQERRPTNRRPNNVGETSIIKQDGTQVPYR